ncbi:tRNA-dihydrouridine synthase 1 [Favolaschia claudopus]|uniref:tRNA-dihydrouridine(16/17) synthase [NAD(P)(+)] n=1 Tax=Favolaschia claudopus TaxID=2862362 RepID=A0AAW0CCX0_9AGAR
MAMGSDIVSNSPRSKLQGYEFYREVLGSPKYIVAPMVDQSELAFRRLCRRYGGQLVYTPMINAKMFADDSKKYRNQYFDIPSGEEGDPKTDRPLIVQFCANDPDLLLTSAKVVEKHCDAVDINLGCPQDIARRGKYGAFLQDDWDLIYSLINTLHKNLTVPVTAKFRVFPSIEKTVEYAKMLERAGAQILTCHGRLREQRGHNTGLASFAHIRAVKENVSVPVFANGNILFQEDIEECLRQTGCDGVMSAEGVLYNPALFVGLSSPSPSEPSTSTAQDTDVSLLQRHPHLTSLAKEYLTIVTTLRTATSASAVKGHLFKILHPALTRHTDLRARLGSVQVNGYAKAKEKREEGTPYWATGLEPYIEIVRELEERLVEDEKRERGESLAGDESAAEETPDTEGKAKTLTELVGVQEATGFKLLPWWLAQPYWRPSPKELPGKGSDTVAAKKRPRSAGAEGAQPTTGELVPEKKLRVDLESSA